MKTAERFLKRILVLVPERRYSPNFIPSVVKLAQTLDVSIRLLASSRFLSNHPSPVRGGFFKEMIELREKSQGSNLSWDSQIIDQPLDKFLKSFDSDGDILAVIKDDDAILKLVLSNSRGPVLVIPRSFKQKSRGLVLAYAGGRFSEQALGMAAMLVNRTRSQLKVLSVGVSSSPSLRLAHSRAQHFFGEREVKAEFQILRGNVREIILEEGANKNVSFLILGASETKEWRDHSFRSLSYTIAVQAECPVLIIK